MTTPEVQDLMDRTERMVDRLQEATVECAKVVLQSVNAIAEAREVAEHARSTAEDNGKIFRTMMDFATRIDSRVTRLEHTCGLEEEAHG